MNQPCTPPDPNPPSNSSSKETVYSVGTLTYTKMGLVSLFAWLL
jgi:hypothetical protein